MKAKITVLFIAVLMACFGLQAQNLLLDNFEGESHNFNIWPDNATTITHVENPDKSGINTSDYVLKVEGTSDAPNWMCIYYDREITIPIGNVNVVNEGEYRYVHFKLHRSYENKIMVEMDDDFASEVWTGGSNMWEYYAVDMLNKNDWSEDLSNKTYGSIKIQLNREVRAYTAYIDDIYLSPTSDPITSTSIKNTKLNSLDINVYRSANGSAFAHIGELDGQLKLEVHNLQGQLLKVVYNDVAATGNYELPSFEKGIYILKATTSKGTYSLKF